MFDKCHFCVAEESLLLLVAVLFSQQSSTGDVRNVKGLSQLLGRPERLCQDMTLLRQLSGPVYDIREIS